MMGRLVWASEAAAGSGWSTIGFERQLMSSLVVVALGVLFLLYGLSGICFGYLPVFVFHSFVPVPGVPALVISIGALSMAVAMSTHFLQRHWRTASKQRCEFVRREAWIFAGLCVALGCAVLVLMVALEIHWLHRPLGLDPHADWALAPLPWVWDFTLPLAREAVQHHLMLSGIALVAIAFVARLYNGDRLAMAAFALIICEIGAYFLGDSSYAYAASRGLKGIVDTTMLAEWSSNPGRINAMIWIRWWGGLAAMAFGLLVFANAFHMTSEKLRTLRR
jgi:hypothetical protein